MNKLQRFKMIHDYKGKPKLVFERRVVLLKQNTDGTWWARVEYTIHTKRIVTATTWRGETALKAVRQAWKSAKRDFDASSKWYQSRGWEWYQFEESNIPQIHDIEENGHLLGLNRDMYYHCSKCGQMWKSIPWRNCPEVPVFEGLWEKAFERAEKHFGFKPHTKGQLDDAGFQTGKKLPKPCAAMEYSNNPSGFLMVYNPLEAIPKRTMTEAQKAALAKAQEATRERYLCQHCRRRLEQHEYGQKYCDQCEMTFWAREILAQGAYILDSETTGLDTESDEIIQLAIIDTQGDVQISTLLHPPNPYAVYNKNYDSEKCAYDIHGISADMLRDAPYLESIYEQLAYITKTGKPILVYNWNFDISMLEAMLQRRDLDPLEFNGYCLMERYAQWFGDIYNHYTGRGRYSHWSYKWKPLNAGHTALGDCFAALERLKEMAK
jgi:DNA polymerase III epsilon subunit-like protein